MAFVPEWLKRLFGVAIGLARGRVVKGALLGGASREIE